MNLVLGHRSRLVLRSVWEMWCWPGSGPEAAFPTHRGWLRRFLLLKLLTVLLGPRGAGVPSLVGCVFSLRALQLLGSPLTSTKPSSVFLAQLALADALMLPHWALRLGAAVARWGVEGERAGWWRDTASAACQQLLDAHHLASLLLLGLLGLEALMVWRWPAPTRSFRTAHVAQISCRLVWIIVLLEFVSLLHLRHQPHLPALPVLSVCMRRMCWLMDSWLHCAVFVGKPMKRKSLFH